MKTRSWSMGIALGIALGLAAPAHAQSVLKVASLAPEGSAWMNLFHDAARLVEGRTQGRVKFKYFAGGVAGDEKDTIRKLRLGQLAGTAVTSVGLGQVYPDLRVLELPFMFQSDAELDYVRGKLSPEFDAELGKRGFVLIGWGDVGWIHLFTSAPLRDEKDLAAMKFWAWTDDPLVRSLFAGMGINAVPLGVPDVLPSLQTGMINAAYGSPLSVLALQWFSKLKYMTEMSVSYAVGGAIMSKKAFDALTPADQAILREEGQRLQGHLIEQIRKDNTKSLEELKKQGLQVIATSKPLSDKFRGQAQSLWQREAGKTYPQALLDKVKVLVAEYRKAHGG